MDLAFDRSGTGEPLVLLHGLGSSRRAWNPVAGVLAERFDVLAIDLPGFGGSAPLPPSVEPTPARLAAAVGELLDGLGITRPHVAGNSLGGWVAMELARTCAFASVTLLSPAGLWRGTTPRYTFVSLRTSRWLAVNASGLLHRLVRSSAGRVVVLGQTHGHPARLTPEYAHAAIDTLRSGAGFDATLRATATRRLVAVEPVDAPVTVAFGSRDRILLRHQSRHLDQLPPDTRVEHLPGCGHVPMADDRTAVAALITRAATRARVGAE